LEQSADVQGLLDRAANYCDKLSQSTLYFVCREQVEEWLYPNSTSNRTWYGQSIFVGVREIYKYIYDYQLIRDPGGSIRESRTLLEDNGKKVRLPNAPLKTLTFTHAYVVMGPLGLLSRDRQADYDFRFVRQEKVGGEKAVAVEAVPKPGLHPDCLTGTVWLRLEDAAVLKIQWNPSSMNNYEGVEDRARNLKMTPSLLMTSEYAFEKNGIRFPSRYTVKEIYAGILGRHFERSQTDVIYEHYQFFTVETEVKY